MLRSEMTAVWGESPVPATRLWPLYAAIAVALLLAAAGGILTLRMFDEIDRLDANTPTATLQR
jgi:hypothetical protein